MLLLVFLYDFIRVFKSATVSIAQLLSPFNHSPDSPETSGFPMAFSVYLL